MMTFLRIFSPARWAMLAGTVALLIIAVLALSWCSERDRVKRARAEANVAAAQSGLGAEAMKRADDLGKAASENRATTQANTDHITEANNAKDDAGDAGLRGRLAYCRRQRLRDAPEPEYCHSLRHAYPAVP